MNRKIAIFCLIMLVSCTKPARSFEEILPPQIEGGWARGKLEKSGTLPALIAQAGPSDTAEALYAGSGTIRIRVYRLKSETSAFELMQKWRQTDGMAVYKGAYFFVANGDGVSPSAIMALLAELQRVNSLA
ncbi:MAG: hypothetical protein H7Y20_15370 [Bryobacteraceae bacterium]|nr:hypothetical protein [Bryobacteraceae bacterium]